MNIIKNFNKFYFSYLLFIFIIAIYYLNIKQHVGNDSTISEWLINYQGGFTKRGLVGEISFQFAKFFDLKLRFVIFFFQSFVFGFYLFILYKFLQKLQNNLIVIISLISPIFLFYYIAELEILARKEIFIFIGYIGFLNLASINNKKEHLLYYNIIILPILCLIWEPYIVFLPFLFFIILIRFKIERFTRETVLILTTYIPTLVVVILILTYRLSVEEHKLMENSLMNTFGEACYMSCQLLITKSSVGSQFFYVYSGLSFTVIFRYLMIVLIGFAPLIYLSYHSYFKNQVYLPIIKKNRNLLFTILLLISPSLLLFAAATDWGRVVNISYTFTILFFLYLLKNDLILVKLDFLKINELIKKNKKKFYLIIFIFAFGWNQKTALTGDIATNSLYKVVYNTSKRIIGFGSIRIFQDSPIIKFHKKFIE